MINAKHLKQLQRLSGKTKHKKKKVFPILLHQTKNEDFHSTLHQNPTLALRVPASIISTTTSYQEFLKLKKRTKRSMPSLKVNTKRPDSSTKKDSTSTDSNFNFRSDLKPRDGRESKSLSPGSVQL